MEEREEGEEMEEDREGRRERREERKGRSICRREEMIGSKRGRKEVEGRKWREGGGRRGEEGRDKTYQLE